MIPPKKIKHVMWNLLGFFYFYIYIKKTEPVFSMAWWLIRKEKDSAKIYLHAS